MRFNIIKTKYIPALVIVDSTSALITRTGFLRNGTDHPLLISIFNSFYGRRLTPQTPNTLNILLSGILLWKRLMDSNIALRPITYPYITNP